VKYQSPSTCHSTVTAKVKVPISIKHKGHKVKNICAHRKNFLQNYYFFIILRPTQDFFHLYGDITMASEGLQTLGLCSALRAFEQGGISIVPHLL
jgi:hypothetical protein